MPLNEEQIERYSRHILLQQVGGKGQEKILNARILIIGAGGLGSPAAYYLAAAGVGTLGIVDSDNVELSNLQRQVLHFTPDVDRPKVISAEEKLKSLNPDVTVKTYNSRVTAENITGLIKDYDFIIEATDNFTAKFLINDACVFNGKPFSQAGVLRFMGQTMTHLPGSACYRCVFDSPPPRGSVPTCSEAGVLGPIPGTIGCIQATEALKYFLGTGQLLTNRILMMDTLSMEFTTVDINRNPDCPICGENPSILELKEYEQPVCQVEGTEETKQR
ncbi:MAG: adenylyltransferase [Spirochaetes bacterium]|nr:MAG: adenylyltransferase [Spirochaetota bacterium]